MSKREKLFARIMGLNKNIRADEIKKVMVELGYTPDYPSGGSSHCTFRKEGRNPVTIPLCNPVSITYIKLVRDTIELDVEEEKIEGGNGGNEEC